MELSLSESEEIKKRKKNIIIKGVITDEVEDTCKLKVEGINDCLKADKRKIKHIHKVGRKQHTGEKTENAEDTNVLDHAYAGQGDAAVAPVEIK